MYKYYIINRVDYTTELQSISIPDIQTAIGNAKNETTVIKFLEETIVPDSLINPLSEADFIALCNDSESGFVLIGDQPE